jgi:hypothetical protein
VFALSSRTVMSTLAETNQNFGTSTAKPLCVGFPPPRFFRTLISPTHSECYPESPMETDPANQAPQPVATVFLLSCPICHSQIACREPAFGIIQTCTCGLQYRTVLAIEPVKGRNRRLWDQTSVFFSNSWQLCSNGVRMYLVPAVVSMNSWVHNVAIPAIVAGAKAAYVRLNTPLSFEPRPRLTAEQIESAMTREAEPEPPARLPPALRYNLTPEGSRTASHSAIAAPGMTSPDIFATLANDGGGQRSLTQLACQMMTVGLYDQAYDQASRAVVADLTDSSAWLVKGVAAAYSSRPPDFRLQEAKLCISEALKSTDLQASVLSIQSHLLRASSHYRQLLRKSCQDVVDDASKEPVTSEVNLGLQYAVRNSRVARVLREKHDVGFVSSVDAIEYAVSLQPSLPAAEMALAELTSVIGQSSFPGMVRFPQQETDSIRFRQLREDLISSIQDVQPDFVPPTLPEPGGCFIATAATGDELHPAVCSLRMFRDQCLNTTPGGRRFVNFYYRTSPTLASLIRTRPMYRRFIFFFVVRPCAGLAEKVIHRRSRDSQGVQM